jgi:hypothetical protein
MIHPLIAITAVWFCMIYPSLSSHYSSVWYYTIPSSLPFDLVWYTPHCYVQFDRVHSSSQSHFYLVWYYTPLLTLSTVRFCMIHPSSPSHDCLVWYDTPLLALSLLFGLVWNTPPCPLTTLHIPPPSLISFRFGMIHSYSQYCLVWYSMIWYNPACPFRFGKVQLSLPSYYCSVWYFSNSNSNSNIYFSDRHLYNGHSFNHFIYRTYYKPIH